MLAQHQAGERVLSYSFPLWCLILTDFQSFTVRNRINFTRKSITKIPFVSTLLYEISQISIANCLVMLWNMAVHILGWGAGWSWSKTQNPRLIANCCAPSPTMRLCGECANTWRATRTGVVILTSFRYPHTYIYTSLAVPHTRTTLGHGSFAVAGPRVCNSLPATL